jgi:hypothetical protein
MNGELQIAESNALAEFGSFRSPDAALREAQQVASVFGRKARAMQIYKKIGESEHLMVEGWQMLAAMYRVTASIESTRYVEYGDAHGWEATAAAIFVPTGQQISKADAMCLDDEDKWGMVSRYEWQDGPNGREKVKIGDVAKPLQQLRSMAQTRAQSKVLSNLLKWVAKMAGFAATPAEEVTHEHSAGHAQTSNPQRTERAGNIISEAQTKRLYAMSRSANRSEEEVKTILQHFGFSHSSEITRDKYDAVCAEIQRGDAQ